MRRATFPVLLIAVLLLAPTTRAQNFSNFSARVDMAPGGAYIIGFDVAVQSTLLLRAVGPSLAEFGVTKPVAAPAMQVYDSNGSPRFFIYSVVALPNGQGETLLGTLPISTIFSDLGAFALNGGEALGGAVNYGIFPPGAYTVKIEDLSGLGGTILFEVYLVPNGLISQAAMLQPG